MAEDIIREIDGETVNLSRPIPDDAEPAYEAAWTKGMAELDRERAEAQKQKAEEKQEEKQIEEAHQDEAKTPINDSHPICPHCGKPLIDINIGESHFYGHEEDDPCKEIYSSIEDIENTRKKLIAIKEAREKAKKEKQKKAVESAIIETNKANKEISQKLDSLIRLWDEKKKEQNTAIQEIQDIVKNKITPMMDKIIEDQAKSSNQAIADFLEKTFDVNSNISTKLDIIDENMASILQSGAEKDDKELDEIELRKKVTELLSKVNQIHICWNYTINPVTKSSIGDKISLAGENQPYFCVKEELTLLNNVLTLANDFQKRINNRLERALNDPKIEPEELERIKEVSTIGRVLLNVWPPSIKIDRSSGDMITQNLSQRDEN